MSGGQRVSLVINTAAGDESIADGSNPYRRARYEERGTLLQTILEIVGLDSYDEIIVAGQWRPGEGYEYVEVPPRRHDRSDALLQRQAGFEASTGDIVVFCHDDHVPAPWTAALIGLYNSYWDILVTERIHDEDGRRLNNGSPEFSHLDGRPAKYATYGYMGSHAPIFKRWVIEAVPWTSVDTEFWDLPMTDLWREAGARIVFTDDLYHLDLEAAPDET